MQSAPARVLIAKTGLDGHWLGVHLVAQALQRGGFEVVVLGTARSDEIVAAALEEDVDLIGLNVGGHFAVVERIVGEIRKKLPDVPLMAGGTISPRAKASLNELGIAAFPPGSSLASILDTARTLVGQLDETVPARPRPSEGTPR
jgi:methylmalonyl-CoA mutase C-terminal domain/subunit